MNSKNLFAGLRVAFGIVWGVDAWLKWSPAFLNGLGVMLRSTVAGQPAIVADWLNLWIKIVGTDPHLFAVIIALAESAIAVCLILDIFPKTTLIGGCFFSLLLWSVGEAFGGPYVAGSTDIGAAVIYAFVFAALYFEKFDVKKFGKDAMKIGNDEIKTETEETKPANYRNLTIKSLLLAVVVLLALLLAPYFVVHMDAEPTAGMMAMATSSAMSGDMVMKAFYLDGTGVPTPTVSFDLIKDTLDGWDLHIITTNFTFTPQNINQAPVADQGHAHLYIDGVLYVVFGPWYHIDGALLPPGKHIVTVSLNANDHSIFSYDRQYIEETKTIYVSPI